MGVQDFNKEVQRLVNRERMKNSSLHCLTMRVRLALPPQHRPDLRPAETNAGEFRFYPKRVAELNPDRLSVFNYAHLRPFLLLSAKSKMLTCRVRSKTRYPAGNHRLPDAIGLSVYRMDHFARPDDELAVAQREGVRTVTSRATPLRAIPICWGWAFRHQHDWRLLRAEPERVEAVYQQVDEQGNALWRGIALTRVTVFAAM